MVRGQSRRSKRPSRSVGAWRIGWSDRSSYQYSRLIITVPVVLGHLANCVVFISESLCSGVAATERPRAQTHTPQTVQTVSKRTSALPSAMPSTRGASHSLSITSQPAAWNQPAEPPATAPSVRCLVRWQRRRGALRRMSVLVRDGMQLHIHSTMRLAFTIQAGQHPGEHTGQSTSSSSTSSICSQLSLQNWILASAWPGMHMKTPH